ncbi:MAG: RecQ family zinc-binding domain-containing protein, partial [Mariprofundaceae bacterium]|nr:RecQ family zinc-binding domain-containing protein [Mariprofundaceae bacterium]
KIWFTVDFEQISSCHHSNRDRIATALDYFSDQQYIELESKRMTDVFEVVSTDFNVDELTEALFEAFKQKEASEINRISQMIAFFEGSDCLSLSLSRYFGDLRHTEPCGVCSVCQGKSAQLPFDLHLPQLATLNPHELCKQVLEASDEPLSRDMLTRFLCGIANPLFNRIKARSLQGFGRL